MRVIKSGWGLSSRNWGQECLQNPQAGKPALPGPSGCTLADWPLSSVGLVGGGRSELGCALKLVLPLVQVVLFLM